MDRVEGTGKHEIDVLLRLHPNCRSLLHQGVVEIVTPCGNQVTVRTPTPGVSVSLKSALYWPQFGVQEPVQVTILSLAQRLPESVTTSITWSVDPRLKEYDGCVSSS